MLALLVSCLLHCYSECDIVNTSVSSLCLYLLIVQRPIPILIQSKQTLMLANVDNT